MAFSVTSKHWLVLVYIFVLSWESGKAYDDMPHLGVAVVIANEYLPQAEDEGETDQYLPQAGIIGTNLSNIVEKALECFQDKYVSNSRLHPHPLPKDFRVTTGNLGLFLVIL
ncbi:uncharacterized protein Fot_52133 [Forsythia ovata]|uniref:Uncharacterized protein n=1 Tax=Forsythia ovata TaxID=205694 RepID=A0ABD1PJU9_9LAMI